MVKCIKIIVVCNGKVIDVITFMMMMLIFSACVDTFNPEARTFYYGGVRTDVQPLNRQNCANACLRNSSCLGFDLDPAAGCFLHFNAANFVVKGSDPNIIHYRRVPCNSTSGAAPTTAAPGAATPTTAAPGKGSITEHIPWLFTFLELLMDCPRV